MSSEAAADKPRSAKAAYIVGIAVPAALTVAGVLASFIILALEERAGVHRSEFGTPGVWMSIVITIGLIPVDFVLFVVGFAFAIRARSTPAIAVTGTLAVGMLIGAGVFYMVNFVR